MSALFDLPLEAETDDGEHILILGVVSNVVRTPDWPPTIMAVEQDGYIRWMQMERLRTKWRWNEEQRFWMDLTVVDEEGETPVEQG